MRTALLMGQYRLVLPHHSVPQRHKSVFLHIFSPAFNTVGICHRCAWSSRSLPSWDEWRRPVSSDAKKRNVVAPSTSTGGSILEQVFVNEEQKPITTAEKVKKAGKDVSYMGILVVGLAVTGGLFYLIFRELFSSDSANGVFSAALKIVKASPQVADVVGTPMKGFGEETRRGRRRYASHVKFEVDGRDAMRMKFYVQGPLARATVHLEVRKDETNTYQYRYLFVQPDGQRHITIILIDNR